MGGRRLASDGAIYNKCSAQGHAAETTWTHDQAWTMYGLVENE